MRLRRVPVALLGLLALASSACAGGNDKADAAPPSSTTSSTEVAGGAVTGPVIAPLTGVADDSGVVTQRPALAIKIDNAPKARPQVGLDAADIVFEEMVEGGVTRFIAVFHSTAPDEVGPVRSVRPMDPNIVSALGGLVAYSGGIPKYVALMRAAPVQDVSFDEAPSAYRRAKDRPRPHNLFARTDALWGLVRDRFAAPPPALFEYRAEGEAFGEADAASVRIAYSRFAASSYDWDAASGSWKRSQNGKPHMAASDNQIAPHNLVVQFVTTRQLGDRDPSGTAVTESIITGEGEAWVFSGGRVTKGRWSKPDASSPTRYTDAAGNPIKLAPGRTWVHLPAVGSAVTIG